MQTLNKTTRKHAGGDSSDRLGVMAVLSLMEELNQLMSREEELVKTRNLDEYAELLKRKQRLTLDYRASMKSFGSQEEALKALPADVRAALKISAQKLAGIAEHNARFLRASITAAQRLIQNIISLIRQETTTSRNYHNPKTAHLVLGNYSPTCRPVAISRTA